MKRVCLFYLLLLPVLRAKWKDLREGMTAAAVIEAVGQPLIRTRARRGLFVTWNYDLGGEVRFARGRVVSWQAPRGRASIASHGQTVRGPQETTCDGLIEVS